MNETNRLILIIVLIGAGLFFVSRFFNTGNDTASDIQPVGRGSVDNYLYQTPQFPKNFVLAEGQTAPEFSYASMDNQVIYLTDYINRKYVVLAFFYAGSPYCQRQLRVLQDYYELNHEIVEIIGITSQPENEKTEIQNLVREIGVEFPIMHDPSGTISDVYRHDYEPFFVFIDLNGTAVNGYTGTIYEIREAIISLYNWEGADEVENNDVRQYADYIGGKLTILGHAHPGDHDWYQLGGQEGTECSFSITFNEDRCDIDMEIYSDENLLGILRESGEQNISPYGIPGTCWLHVFVYSGGEGAYTIEIEPSR